VGYVVLALSAFSYAVGIVAQTVAARRAERRNGVDVGLLARLATDRVYLLGFAAQCVGFVLAFLARADLPLYLVQAGAMSAVGIAAVLGAVLLGWRIRTGEIGALVVIACGLVLLVGAAKPGPAQQMSLGTGLVLAALLIVVLGLAVPASRLAGPRAALVFGLLAGLAFAVLAIVSRPLAAGPLAELPLRPETWLMVAAAVVGQALLAAALQRGSTTAAMASMDSTSVLLSSVVGLVVLGDQVAVGRGSWVGAGLALVVIGVIVMAVVQPHKPVSTRGRTTTRSPAGTAPEGVATR
jgi:drug/metabolite transporter (DMT)-like permease